jgi:PIN domain nuclease of toxin-antitoxin system
MNVLLDTRILLWALYSPDELSPQARDLLEDPENTVSFSAASIWEIAIKTGLKRKDFAIDPLDVRTGALRLGFHELPVDGAHAAAVVHLPMTHRDPFDRLLIAQSRTAGLTLLTHDKTITRYPGPTRLV